MLSSFTKTVILSFALMIMFSACGKNEQMDGQSPKEETAIVSKVLSMSQKEKFALLHEPIIAPEDLIALAFDKDTEVRKTLALAPQVTEAIFVVLAQDENQEIHQLVMQNPHIGERTLTLLSQDKDPMIRALVALSSKVPEEVKQKIFEDQSLIIQAAGSSVSEEVAQKIMQGSDVSALEVLAQNPKTVLSMLQVILQEVKDLKVLNAVAKNPEADTAILNQVYEQAQKNKSSLGVGYLVLMNSLVNNKNASEELLAKIYNEFPKDFVISMGVAMHKNVGGDVLKKLMSSSYVFVRMQVARNESLPHELFALFAQDKELLVRKAIAENPWITPELLAQLSTDADVSVRTTVAKHKSTSTDVLRKLAYDKELAVQYAAVDNPNMPKDVLEDLAKNDDFWFLRTELKKRVNADHLTDDFMRGLEQEDLGVIWSIIENRQTPPSILERLSNYKNTDVRAEVGYNSNTSLNVLLKLASDNQSWVRRRIADNCAPYRIPVLNVLASDEEDIVRFSALRVGGFDYCHLSEYVFNKLFNDPSKLVRAVHPKTLISDLKKLVTDPDVEVRKAVASRIDVQSELFDILAYDQDELVRDQVVQRENLPEKFFKIFLKDPSHIVRRSLLVNPNTPTEILDQLFLQDTSIDFHEFATIVITNNKDQKYALGVLDKLASDENEKVRAGVARNPKTPAGTLLKLVNDMSREVRYGVAVHPNTPKDTVEQLAKDPDQFVAQAAQLALQGR